MTKEEQLMFWSKQYGRVVTEAEVEEVNFNLKAFADLLYDCYIDFRKRGVIDKEANFLEKFSGEGI